MGSQHILLSCYVELWDALLIGFVYEDVIASYMLGNKSLHIVISSGMVQNTEEEQTLIKNQFKMVQTSSVSCFIVKGPVATKGTHGRKSVMASFPVAGTSKTKEIKLSWLKSL